MRTSKKMEYAHECPYCGGELQFYDDTTNEVSGVWYEMECPDCGRKCTVCYLYAYTEYEAEDEK